MLFNKISQTDIASMQQAADTSWQVALEQSKTIDRILAHMVQVSYPEQDWAEVLPAINEISPASVATIPETLERSQDFNIEH